MCSIVFVQELDYSNYILQRLVFRCPGFSLDMLILYYRAHHSIVGLYNRSKIVNRSIESEFFVQTVWILYFYSVNKNKFTFSF